MALWLFGAIEEIDCEGEGCPFCSYQIYKVDWQKIASNFYSTSAIYGREDILFLYPLT